MYKTTFNAIEKEWSGKPMPLLYNPKLSIGHGLLRAMKVTPQKIAQVKYGQNETEWQILTEYDRQISANNGIRVTFEEMHMKTVRAAQNLQKLNHTKDEMFVMITKNNHDVAPICMALLCIGQPFYTFRRSFDESEAIQMLEMMKPKVIFCEIEVYAMIKKCATHLGSDARIYTFCGKIADSFAVEDLYAETGIEEEFV